MTVPRRVCPAVLLTLALTLGCSQAPGTRSIDAPTAGPEVTSDGAWCWFADPRAVSFAGVHERTYTGWVDSSGGVWVASIDHETGEVDSTLIKGFSRPDDHANPAVVVRPTGHLAVFLSDHGGGGIQYLASLRPEDVSAWSPPRILRPGTGPISHGFTYPNPILLSSEEGRTYLFYRGRIMRPAFIRSEPTGAWSREYLLVDGDVEDSYLKCASDGESEIHLAFTDGHPRGRPNNSIYYARYSEETFVRADGGRICDISELPFRSAEADVVYDAGEEGARAWVWDIAVGPDGYPVIVFAVFPRESDHRYRYARWDGSSWQSHEIVSAGGWFPDTPMGEEEKEVYYSAGIALDHDDPSVVYLSRRVRGIFEVERWVTRDGGDSWRSSPVTQNSTLDNVRPVVPRSRRPDGVQLLWMAGPYVSYTDFGTSIHMLRH